MMGSLTQQHQTNSSAERPDTSAAVAQALRILLVDDDPSVRRILRRLLQLDNHLVEEAASGREAIDVFRFHPSHFDIVLTDWEMPDVNGGQLAHAIKQQASSTPVIMLTGLGEPLDDSTERPGDVDLVLGKPVGLAKLRQALARVMQGQRRHGSPHLKPGS